VAITLDRLSGAQNTDRPRRDPVAKASVAFVGTYVPRACGIATFTRDLRQAVGAVWDGETPVIALDRGGPTDPAGYPEEVVLRLGPGPVAPGMLEGALGGGSGVMALQHEFGIFGGERGEDVMDLLGAARWPVVSTLHTVPVSPDRRYRALLRAITKASARVVVMSHRGARLLTQLYDVPLDQVRVIPHGVPDIPFGPTEPARRRMGYGDDRIILSFGLLSPNKGLELAIRALADCRPRVPRARLVIAGRTHPEIVRREGEAYRKSLRGLADELGVLDRVTFVDHYLDAEELRQWLMAADVFVTPYGDSAQITSGTLAYAVASGRAVVSTPYEHARELLVRDTGLLVPFGDVSALSAAIRGLLLDDDGRERMRWRAWCSGRGMVWPAVGSRYADLFREVLVGSEG
jgi:glycosyltransferase involved in cell wall biosynthesis